MAEVEWLEEASEDLGRLDKAVAKRILRKIEWLSTNFERIIPENLSGDFMETYKLRAGSWRIVYSFDDRVIVIRNVGHRKDIYKSREQG